MHPQKEALVDVEQGERLTYEQYNRGANRAANVIRGLGVKPGDRVALLLGNGSRYMELFFALAKLGAVCVPLNCRLTPDELAFILEDSGAETLIYGDAFREVAADLHSRGEGATAVRRWVHLGESVDPFALRLGDLLASTSDDEPDLAGFEDDPLFIMYTSGTASWWPCPCSTLARSPPQSCRSTLASRLSSRRRSTRSSSGRPSKPSG
jgi:acyl-CoA synthetase (AMP-forming)/AMP-acid ligase II